MKQILPRKNLVFTDDTKKPVSLDCSAIPLNVDFIGWDGDEKWAELCPFAGRITGFDFTVADALFAQAVQIEYDKAHPTYTFAQLKERKLDALRSKRIDVAEGGITVSGRWVPTDKDAVVLFTATLDYLSDKAPTKTIKRAGFGEMDKAQVKALFDAVAAHYDAVFAKEAELFDLISAATSAAELDAVDIDSGW